MPNKERFRDTSLASSMNARRALVETGAVPPASPPTPASESERHERNATSAAQARLRMSPVVSDPEEWLDASLGWWSSPPRFEPEPERTPWWGFVCVVPRKTVSYTSRTESQSRPTAVAGTFPGSPNSPTASATATAVNKTSMSRDMTPMSIVTRNTSMPNTSRWAISDAGHAVSSERKAFSAANRAASESARDESKRFAFREL